MQTKLNFGTAQQDISELFYLVLEKIEEERKLICPGHIMTINCVDLFECLNAHCTYRGPTETSLEISVKFESDFNVSLEELINSQQNKQFNFEHQCTKCYQKGTSRSHIFTSVSRYLNVYVRRVQFKINRNFGIKKQTAVKFNETLRIAVAFESGNIRYETFTLIGFILHIGSQAAFGHYVCFIKKDEQWELHDDHKVFLVNRRCVFREFTYKNVYLLTYGSDS